MKTFLGISIVFLGVILISCHKEKDPEYVYLSSYTKDHFYFKKGSYWIYKDSVSNRIDSFFINSSSIELNSDGLNLYNKIDELLKLTITQVNFNSIKDNIQWNYIITDNSLVASYKKNDSEFSIVRGKFYTPQDLKLYYSNNSSTHLIIYKYGEVILNSKKHFNVWKLFFEDSFATNKNIWYKTAYSYNDSAGPIKMQLAYDNSKTSINEVWELQRWSVIK